MRSAAVGALHQATEENHQVSVLITPNTSRPRLEPKAPASPSHCTQDTPPVASTRSPNPKTPHVFLYCPNIEKGWVFLVL